MKNFGQNLKQLRTDRDFSQEAFAAQVGVHATNLSKYERGISIPSLEIAERMAAVLGISMDELVYGAGEQRAKSQISDDQLLRLFNKTQQLNEQQKATVSQLLDAFLFKAGIAKQLA